ncbi:hypothetical protein [Vibrio cincinnatiensis]|uniref:hypothetical protein n=1 Tax=Vibrio cincinnatiensis TaxID=675 RepID=UPI001EDD58D8|nr:hypothetical protein [Vibrio cincinnatiensis]
MKKYTEEQLKNMQDKTDYERLENMTEEEIEENSVMEEDSATPSDTDMSNFRKVKDNEQ